MKSVVVFLFTALLAPAGAFAAAPKELVGRYQMDVADGDVMELRADGTASMAGDETKWSATASQLTIGPDTVAYTLAAGALKLQMGGVDIVWKKVGAAGKGPSPLQKAAQKAKAAEPQPSEDEADREALQQAQAFLAANGGQPPGQMAPQQMQPMAPQPVAGGPSPQQKGPMPKGTPQDEQVKQLLLSSPGWCYMRFSKVSGTTSTERVGFLPNGTAYVKKDSETYSSGYGGTVAGQYQNGFEVQWKVQNARLLVDDGRGWQDVNLSVTLNSNGYPILHGGGKEYSKCQ